MAIKLVTSIRNISLAGRPESLVITPFLIVIVLFHSFMKSYTIVVNLKPRFETVFSKTVSITRSLFGKIFICCNRQKN